LCENKFILDSINQGWNHNQGKTKAGRKLKKKEMRKTQIEEMLNRKENRRCNELDLVEKKLGWTINNTRWWVTRDHQI
jgi:hypothetical protein